MTVFTEWPSAFVLARAALVLLAFVFLPGYFLALARAKIKKFEQLLLEQPAEALAESVFTSLAILGFAVMLLMFSVGFSYFGLLVLELIALWGAWTYWRKNI